MENSEIAADGAGEEEQGSQTGSGAPSEVDQPDGGPGSHSEGQTGGAENDPASGGIPDDDDGDVTPSP